MQDIDKNKQKTIDNITNKLSGLMGDFIYILLIISLLLLIITLGLSKLIFKPLEQIINYIENNSNLRKNDDGVLKLNYVRELEYI